MTDEDEFRAAMLARFPVLLAHLAERPRAMSPSIALDGFKRMGPGWRPLLLRLLARLEELRLAMPEPERGVVRVVQVKEKLGELRVYVDDGSVAMYEETKTACVESTQICEECGAPGERRALERWLHTTCDAHIPEPRRR